MKPAAFDLFLGGCIAGYLGIVYYAIQVCQCTCHNPFILCCIISMQISTAPCMLPYTFKALSESCAVPHTPGLFSDNICWSCLTEFRLSLHKAESSSEIQAPVNKTVNAESMTRALKSALHMLDFCLTGCADYESENLPRLIVRTTYKGCICFELFIVVKTFVPVIIHESIVL